MRFRTFLKDLLETYFIVVTLVDAAMFILGTAFRPGDTFGYDTFLSPLLYGALGVLPMLVTYSRNELSVKQMLVRKVLQLVLLEAVLIAAGLGFKTLDPGNTALTVSFAAAVLIIFVSAHLFSWMLDAGQAGVMNRELMRMKEDA